MSRFSQLTSRLRMTAETHLLHTVQLQRQCSLWSGHLAGNVPSAFLPLLLYHSSVVSCVRVNIFVVNVKRHREAHSSLQESLRRTNIYGRSICLFHQIRWSGSWAYVSESSHTALYSVARHQTFLWGQRANNREPARKQNAGGWLITPSISSTVFTCFFSCRLLCEREWFISQWIAPHSSSPFVLLLGGNSLYRTLSLFCSEQKLQRLNLPDTTSCPVWPRCTG